MIKGFEISAKRLATFAVQKPNPLPRVVATSLTEGFWNNFGTSREAETYRAAQRCVITALHR